MSLGENIKRMRLEKHLKQSELAEKANISRVALGNYERNDRTPNATILKSIAEALETTTSQLLGDNVEEIENNLKAVSTSTIVSREAKTIKLIQEIVKISDDLGYAYSLEFFNRLSIEGKVSLSLDLHKFINKQVKSFLYLNGTYKTLPQNMQSHFELPDTETIEAIKKELNIEDK